MHLDLPGAVTIEANHHLLSQALSNLLDNAIKYGASGGIIDLGLVIERDRVLVRVGDHGPGVPTSQREHVLARFVRLDASRGRPGSGLGLSWVAAVADLHGAVLQLEDNRPGLCVTLSFAKAAASHDVVD